MVVGVRILGWVERERITLLESEEWAIGGESEGENPHPLSAATGKGWAPGFYCL